MKYLKRGLVILGIIIILTILISMDFDLTGGVVWESAIGVNNFSDYDRFRIYDNKEEVESNQVYIYGDENFTALSLVNVSENNSDDDVTFENVGIGGMGGNWDKINWILWGVIIIVLGIIMFIIWFFILRKNNLSDVSGVSLDAPPAPDSSNGSVVHPNVVSYNKNNINNSPVGNYLKKLDLPEE